MIVLPVCDDYINVASRLRAMGSLTREGRFELLHGNVGL
jgi:hypothetical protein